MNLSRRSALLGLSAALTFGRASLALANAPTDRRFIVIILRGGLDGMAAVVPYGDPALAGLRSEIVPPGPGQPRGLLDLGGFYGLYPTMTHSYEMFKAGELAPVHAVAGPYRTRSHFDAQDFMESGSDHRMDSGWLNRAVAALDPSTRDAEKTAVAIGVTVPLLLRGPTRIASWGPSSFRPPPEELYAQAAALAAADPVIGPALASGLHEDAYMRYTLGRKGLPHDGHDFVQLAVAAGKVLSTEGGPRIAAIEMNGFDTHSNQPGLLQYLLPRLDSGLGALKQNLGPAWRETVVLTMTEFGRTAHADGTLGTDHGTASVAFVAGGAVAGGRVVATWPGLGPGRLLDNRDLEPTVDLRSVAKGLLKQHVGLGDAALAQVFPGSGSATPLMNLVHT